MIISVCQTCHFITSSSFRSMLTTTLIHLKSLQELEFLLQIFSRIEDNTQRMLVNISRLRFLFEKIQVLTVVTISITPAFDATPCSMVYSNQYFGVTCYLHFQHRRGVVYSGIRVPYTLKMETIGFSEMITMFYENAWRYISEDSIYSIYDPFMNVSSCAVLVRQLLRHA